MRARTSARLAVAAAVLASVPATVLTAVPAMGQVVDRPALAGRQATSAEQRLLAKAEAEGPQPVIVEFASKTERGRTMSALDGFDTKRSFDTAPLVSGWADAGTLGDLTANGDVVRVYPNDLLRPAVNSAMAVTGADRVQRDLGLTGKGKTIAIIDTGVDSSLAYFGDRVIAEACFSASGHPDWDDPGTTLCPNGEHSQIGRGAADATIDDCYNEGDNICFHGSFVTGIAAGKAVEGSPGNGLAPDAKIIAVQACSRFDDADGIYVSCWRDDIIAGLEWVKSLSQTGKFDIVAANVSLVEADPMTEYCDAQMPTTAAVNALKIERVAVTWAAGNNGFLDAVGASACVKSALAIGNTQDDDTIRASSNRGKLLDFFAPGSSITSSLPDGGWATYSGTSLSAPHVAGAIALLREQHPLANVSTMERLLRDTGVPITYDSNGTEVTTPRINVAAAAGLD